MSFGTHVIIRPRDDRVICTSLADIRAASAIILEVGERFGLYTFGIAGRHAHGGVLAEMAAAREYARRIEIRITLRMGFDAGFHDVWTGALESSTHRTRNLWYDARQGDRHDVVADPYFEGSIVWDALGLRPARESLLERIRLAEPNIRHDRIEGRCPRTVMACTAAVQAIRAQLSSVEIAALLNISARSVRRAQAMPVDPRLVRAITRQLRMRERLVPDPTSVVLLGSAAPRSGVPERPGIREVIAVGRS